MRTTTFSHPLVLLLLCLGAGGCYAPSAARRAGHLLSDGWSVEERGAWVALTGPGTSVAVVGDFLVHALVPIDYDGYFLVDRREPEQQWFRDYLGPMLPLDQVSVLCKTRRSIHVREIQDAFDSVPHEARHEAWHFPTCIEVMPGVYQLTVEYYSRRHYDTNSHLATFTTESTSPAVVEWVARPGRVYRLDARLGAVSPSPEAQRPGSTIKTVPPSKRKLGTSRFLLDVGSWYAIVEPVGSWHDLDPELLAIRSAWQRYESLR